MAVLKKILIGTGIGAGIVGGFFGIRKLIRYSKSMTDLETQLETVVTAQIFSLKLDGLTIKVDATLKNPTGGTLKMKFPFVKVLYNEDTLGTSKVIDQDVVLPAYGEAQFNDIMINIPVMGLFSLTGAVVDLLVKKQAVPVFVIVRTTLDLGWKTLAKEDTHKITLNPIGNGSNLLG